MNRPALLRFDRAIREVDWLAEHVQHAAEGGGTDRHRNRRAGVGRGHAALHAVGRLHRDRAHTVLAQVLLDLDDDVHRVPLSAISDAHRVVDGGEVVLRKLHVHHGANHPDDLADVLLARCSSHSLLRSLAGLGAGRLRAPIHPRSARIRFPSLTQPLSSPGLRIPSARTLLNRGLHRLRARDDLDDLARDRGLPHLVHVERQPIHHVLGVARGRVHRRHARCVLGGR